MKVVNLFLSWRLGGTGGREGGRFSWLPSQMREEKEKGGDILQYIAREREGEEA